MKNKLIALLFSLNFIAFSQSETDIFLFDINASRGGISLKNGKNISDNLGYDNQPHFFSDDVIVFASNRNGQTDIASFTISTGKVDYISKTPKGGEYSPQKIPKKYALSAVRLDDDGKQRLYSYNWVNGQSEELIKDLVVAYYTWYDDRFVVSAVIEDDNLNLYVSDIVNGTNKKIASNVGRSFHTIPDSDLVSYIYKGDGNQWQIRSLDPKTGKTNLIANVLKDVEDICWLNNSTLLSSKNSTLYKLTLQRDNSWKKVVDLSSQKITDISRIAVNSNGTKLAMAVETISISKSETTTPNTATSAEAVEAIVQHQLEAYNARDINAFLKAFSQDVKVYNYPNSLMTEGRNAMRPNYEGFFKNTPDLHCKILERIVIGNKVIDHEHVTVNGNTFKAVAIYEVEDGLIAKVTFIR